MKKVLFISLFTFICCLTVHAQSVYVDCNTGNDKNPGTKDAPVFSIHKAAEIIKSRDNDIYTMKINPGIYVLEHNVSIATEKDLINKRIVIEASILPDDTSWTHEKMPVITCKALKGEIPENAHFVNSFRIDESHVTIRGLKFHGYFYPHTRSCPIGRFDNKLTDLLVEQCVFVGDPNVSQLHVGIYADGDEVIIDHCVFYKVRNTVVFGKAPESGIKNGNGIKNSIIYEASQGLWTSTPDKDFLFTNNIVANCRYAWVRGNGNTTRYSMNNCIIVNNKFYTGVPGNGTLNPVVFEKDENNVIRSGEISLRLTGVEDQPALDCVDKPLPIDYLHVIPGTLGHEMGAGIFKQRKE